MEIYVATACLPLTYSDFMPMNMFRNSSLFYEMIEYRLTAVAVVIDLRCLLGFRFRLVEPVSFFPALELQ